MTTNPTESAPAEEPLAELERHLIGAYLARAGQDFHTLLTRHDKEARELLTAASLYAAGKLTEVESRLHYLRALRGEA